jgi:hypothetical protein
MSVITRLFGTSEEKEAAREARRRAAEEAGRARVGPHVRRLKEESIRLSADLVRRFMSGQLASGVVADRTAIKAIGTALRRCGKPAVGPLCALVEECERDDRLIYAAQEAISVLADLGDGGAVPAIVRGASVVGAVRDEARPALMKLGGQAAVNLLEQKIALGR